MRDDEREDLFPFSFDYEPWLIQLHGKKKAEQEFINPYNHRVEERKVPQLAGKLCLGCFDDWLLLGDESTKAIFFLHRTLDPELTVHLPSLRGESFQKLGCCVLSSSPTSRECVVTFVVKTRNVVLYCRPNEDDAYWNKVSLSIDQVGHSFNGQVVRSKGEIYALHGCNAAHQVVVINEEALLMGDCRCRKILQIPDLIDSCTWHYLVASSDEIFLVSVALCLFRGTPTYYTIHLLETSDLSWKRVDSIGGRAFFLGGIHNSSLSAIQARMQRDCIFIVNLNNSIIPGQGIYRICMRDQTVNLNLLLMGRKYQIWDKLCWAMPIRSRKSKRETSSFSRFICTYKRDATYVNKEKNKEKCNIETSRPWADMPIELVQLLLRHLSLVDRLRLPSVCKACNSLSNPIQEAQVYPWLMYPIKDSSLWRLFDPIHGKEYSIDMTWLEFSKDLTFHYSKDGWFLASKEDNSLFLLNPLTKESVSLPYLDARCRANPLVFSSAPTSPDCVVFRVEFTDTNILEISTWSPGEEEWSKVIFVDELRGELLVFDPKKKTRRVLEIQAPIEIKLFTGDLMECYLVESDGDLITVFRGSIMDPIRVFKLDKLNMVWKELDDMGDVAIFLDRRTSFAKSYLEKKCHNQIYLSGFTHYHGMSAAFYSLEAKRYYPEIYYLLKEHINCIWIEPSLTAQ